MEFAFLVPTPDPIPIPWMWLQALLMATFVVHLLFMNAMLGSGIIALVAMFRRTTNSLPMAKTISTTLPTLIAFTVNTGVAPLLFVHVLYGQFIFSSSTLMAVWWLSAVGILLVAYYAAYLFDFKFEAMGTSRTWTIAVATGLLLLVGFLFSNNMTLMLSPNRWGRYLENPGGTLLNLADPMLIPRYLHFVTASVAVGGLVLAWIWQLKEKKGVAGAKEKTRQAMGWFSWATTVQFAVGTAFLFSLPKTIRALFLGGEVMATVLFSASLTAAIVALHLGFRHKVRPSTAAAVITIVFMALVRDRVRQAFLAPFFTPADLPVALQTGPFVLFLASLVLGIAAVVFMIRLAFGRRQEVKP